MEKGKSQVQHRVFGGKFGGIEGASFAQHGSILGNGVRTCLCPRLPHGIVPNPMPENLLAVVTGA